MIGAAVWADALQALALFAADPIALGGLAVRAGAGPVRDRFLALLRACLPPGMPMRRLPLHIADDRLLGGLDLAATLQAGKPVAQKGLLAEADGGVVVVAMAERMEGGTTARLRAAIDAGAVTLQRDGLSRVMATRFGVVALDEGAEADERTPAALLDRLAFHVDLTAVSLRDVAATDPLLPDPARSAGRISAESDDDDGIAEAICQAAAALGIDSVRAPLFAWRAARIAAALADHDAITEDDLGLAARLVLAPRATRLPPAEDAETPEDPVPPEPAEDDAAEAQTRPDQPLPDQTLPDRPLADQPLPDQPLANQPLSDRPLADQVLDAAKAALPPDLLARLMLQAGDRGLARVTGRAGQLKASVTRGRPVGTRRGEPRNGARLHLLETLKAAAPWQTLRRRSERFEVRPDDFRIVRFRQRIGTTSIFAVDASGSAAMHRLAEAKGAVELLLADCYVRRDQVALIAFRGHGATLLLPPTGSLLRAKRGLAGLPGGGPTPLAAGIEAAMTLAMTIRRGGRTPVITLLTDGRANIARDGTGGRPHAEAEAMEAARALRMSNVATLLVDTSPRPNPFAHRLAEAMAAHYLPLPYADAAALSRAVRSAAAA